MLSLLPLPALATCGGGGGGGMGGIPGGGGDAFGAAQVYRVPWVVLAAGAQLPPRSLVVYWFPTSPAEARASTLLASRDLTFAAMRCVGLAVVTSDNAPLRERYAVVAAEPQVVLARADGIEVGRIAPEKGNLALRAVEKMVEAELDRREDAAKAALKAAGDKDEKGDKEGAVVLYEQIWSEHCLVPGPAKKAAKALKKLGKPVADEAALNPLSPVDPGNRVNRLGEAEPNRSSRVREKVLRAMAAGLTAEGRLQIGEAEREYERAAELDPADPVPLRFLGELHRHHTGNWAQARSIFARILAMPADALSRAVALHGLGKMTIHEGEFDKGLDLFERSLAEFPLALTYRNLAVYWYSEQQPEKAAEYVAKALALEPEDEYNQIFAAVYLAAAGKKEEAAKVAREHERVLAASYNLAAIYAQLGEKDKALQLLRRHFYAYEQFDLVRAREMKEAREDFVFVALRDDPAFVKLTDKAMPGKGMR